jgi:glycosyltransferase involved in cell wall biosynthesis
MHTGGTEQHLLHVLPALAERGFDITAMLLAGGGALEPRLREASLAVVAPEGDRGRPFRTIDMVTGLRKAIRAKAPKVVHAFLSEPYLAAYVAYKTMPGPKPPLVHGRRSLAFYMKNHPFLRPIEHLAHRTATRLVGNSTAVATELMTECGAPEKVVVINNGIPLAGPVAPAERAAAREAFGIDGDELLLAMVANFHSYKGHADLIDALEIAAPRLPARWRLALPGRDGGSLKDLRARIGAAGLQDRVIFPGELPGSRQIYAAADIGLLASHTEGFSNSLIEGMAAELPMIATAVGGNLDAIDDGETGLLVPVLAPTHLAAAILSLADDVGLRVRLGAAARARTESRFSLDACVTAYERLWREMAAL